MSQLNFKKTTLINQILGPLGKFTEMAKIQIDNKKLTALTHTSGAEVIFYATMPVDIEGSVSLNLPDIAKLIRVINCIDADDICLTHAGNKLEYKTRELKFNYHLLEDAVMPRCAITAEKIENFGYDSSFTIPQHKVAEILKNSAFAADTEKLYFIQDGETVLVELGDHEKANTDNLTFIVSTDANTETPLSKAYPIKIETLRYFSGLKFDKVTVRVNNSRRVLCFEFAGDVKIKYIVSALVK